MKRDEIRVGVTYVGSGPKQKPRTVMNIRPSRLTEATSDPTAVDYEIPMSRCGRARRSCTLGAFARWAKGLEAGDVLHDLSWRHSRPSACLPREGFAAGDQE